jgi:hypothetical protein
LPDRDQAALEARIVDPARPAASRPVAEVETEAPEGRAVADPGTEAAVPADQVRSPVCAARYLAGSPLPELTPLEGSSDVGRDVLQAEVADALAGRDFHLFRGRARGAYNTPS